MRRIGIFGWGLVAPKSPDIESFAANLERSETWLTPFEGFGPSTFLVGEPAFDFQRYKTWIDERFRPNRFPMLLQKMGDPALFAIGAFIQSLQQNPGIEQTLQELGNETHVLIGTGLGDLPTQYDCSIDLYFAQRRWDLFWSAPERNADRSDYESADAAGRIRLCEDWNAPDDPRDLDVDEVSLEQAHGCWNAFWTRRSDALARFLDDFDAIESEGIGGEVKAGKLGLIRRKKGNLTKLEQRWGCPPPPWRSVSANLIWNIANIPAAQVSMLGGITGPAWAPVAACSTFGVCLRVAADTIQAGHAKAVVIGATDPRPHPMSVSAFFQGRVLASDRRPSLPLSDLRGTHVAGGACVWIVGDHEFMTAQGFESLGLEILGVGVTSDADHIITPSAGGPQECVRQALASAGVDASALGTWDLHATATPGDHHEVASLREVIPGAVAVTARKGTFGHGMAVGGGWELTAQHLGLTRGKLFPTPLKEAQIHQGIAEAPYRYVLDTVCPSPPGLAGKLSMGIGGINACVISRLWEDSPGTG